MIRNFVNEWYLYDQRLRKLHICFCNCQSFPIKEQVNKDDTAQEHKKKEQSMRYSLIDRASYNKTQKRIYKGPVWVVG